MSNDVYRESENDRLRRENEQLKKRLAAEEEKVRRARRDADSAKSPYTIKPTFSWWLR